MGIKEIKGEADLNDIQNIVLHRVGENPNTVAAVLDAFFDVLAEALATYNRVELHNRGVFSLVSRAPRAGIAPNGEPWETPARYEIEFDAAPKFAELVRQHLAIEPGAPVI